MYYSFIKNSLPPSGKKARLEPPLPLEILASDPPPLQNFQQLSVGGGGGGMDIFWNN